MEETCIHMLVTGPDGKTRKLSDAPPMKYYYVNTLATDVLVKTRPAEARSVYTHRGKRDYATVHVVTKP